MRRVRESTPSLRYTDTNWCLTVDSVEPRRAAISRLARPVTTRSTTARSAGVRRDARGDGSGDDSEMDTGLDMALQRYND